MLNTMARRGLSPICKLFRDSCLRSMPFNWPVPVEAASEAIAGCERPALPSWQSILGNRAGGHTDICHVVSSSTFLRIFSVRFSCASKAFFNFAAFSALASAMPAAGAAGAALAFALILTFTAFIFGSGEGAAGVSGLVLDGLAVPLS